MPHDLQPTKISQTGVNLIKKFEGLHKVREDGMIRSYRDPVGVWTIGYGRTKGVRSGQVISPEEAEQFLAEDLSIFETAVRDNVHVPLTQHQFDSLVSWTYNLGETNLRSSTMLRKLNQGQYHAVPGEMSKWNKARIDGRLTPLSGLTRRRAAEGALFTLDADVGDTVPQPHKKVETGTARQKPLQKSRTMWGAAMGAVGATLQSAAAQLQPLAQYSDFLQPAALTLTVIGIALVTFARIDDHIRGV